MIFKIVKNYPLIKLMAPDRYEKNPIENPKTNSTKILAFRSSVNTLRDKQD